MRRRRAHAVGADPWLSGSSVAASPAGFHARVGDIVQWDVPTLGDEFHTLQMRGHRRRASDGTFVDTKTIGPAESFGIFYHEEAPGTWRYHSHVESHTSAGMVGLCHVRR